MGWYSLAQCFGILAFCLHMASGYQKNPGKILRLTGGSNLFWVGHYLAISSPLAAAMSLLAALRLYLCAWLPRKYVPCIVVASLILFMTVTIKTYTAPHSLLPVIGSTIFTLTLLFQDKALYIRFGNLACAILWMAHGMYTLSLIEIFSNGCVSFSILYGIIKYEYEIPAKSQLARHYTVQPGKLVNLEPLRPFYEKISPLFSSSA